MRNASLILLLLGVMLLNADVVINGGDIQVNEGAYFQIAGTLTVNSGGFHSYTTMDCNTETIFQGTEGSLDAITIVPDANMGGTTVTHHSGSRHPSSTTAIRSWWEINPTNTGTCTVTLRMRDQDVTGFTLADLIIWEWNGLTWLSHIEATNISQTSSGGYTAIVFSNLALEGGRANHVITLATEGTPLPVELSSFSVAQTSSNLAQICWITQSETDVLGYNIYRNTTDNITSAVCLNDGIIPGTNSTEENRYSYLDTESTFNQLYYYWLECVSLDNSSSRFGPLTIILSEGQNPEDIPEVVLKTGIRQIFPNPFNPSTTVAYTLVDEGYIRLCVYNLRGQLVYVLEDGLRAPGEHRAIWDGRDNTGTEVASGVYLFRLETGGKTYLHKGILIK